jgi:Uma2 family endonuclease
MSVLTWPDHLMSLPEWEALPEDGRYRLEVVEGVLHVAPRPLFLHQRAVMRLGGVLDEQLPTRLSVGMDFEIIIEEQPLTVRAPDVVVIRSDVAQTNPARCRPSDVVLAVEVLSEGSVRTDRVMIYAEYADAGIAHYWIVDLAAPTSITAYSLVDGTYEVVGEHTTTAVIDVDGAPVTLDLPALTALRGPTT